MIIAPAMCFAILIGIFAEARTRIRPETTENYHLAAKNAIESVPTIIGTWMSKPEEVPPEALKLLRTLKDQGGTPTTAEQTILSRYVGW